MGIVGKPLAINMSVGLKLEPIEPRYARSSAMPRSLELVNHVNDKINKGTGC